MGELKNKRIVQSRSWHDPKQLPVPTYDYDYTYPITVYDAVKRTIDENATNLTDELEGIYRLLKNKQDIILPGTPGKLMTWSGIQGQIGSMDITRAINEDPVERTHSKLPTERAVGEVLDTKASLLQLYQHTSDSAIHITDVERSKWNSMTPASTFNSHTSNAVMHITNEERKYWNSKADGANMESHIRNVNNPHNVTAHQTGTYTRQEIDEHFASLRETFFNYLNIRYDERNDVAVLDKYSATNWNPNYVMAFGETLPDVIDPNKIYFAVKPATDFNTNETQDVIIYIKKPGLSWVEIGSTTLRPGDLLIRFPDTRMYVWMQGRFIRVFTDSKAEEDDLEGQVWRPKVTEEGEISWVLSKETKPPTPQNIKGKDGYTPIKGVDYVDGKDGEGVPIGGSTGEFLIKNSDENYDTAWKAPSDIFKDLVLAGLTLPENLVEWDKIKGRPFSYPGLGDNDNGFITQKGVTHQFEVLNSTLSELTAKVTGPTGIETTRNELYEHIHDYSNPHRVNAVDIGAVPTATFNSHITNMNNPHNVTKEQIGLSKVDNTADMDKPVSTAVEAAIKAVSDSLESLNKVVGGSKYITNARWDAPTNILEFTFKDGEKLNVEIPITDALSNITFDKKTKELVIQLPNGTENRINISSLIKVYKGSVSANIQTIIENDDIIKSTIIPNSIGEMEIQESVHLKSSPTTTTQPVSDRSDRISTTKFVGDQVINNLISYETDRPLSANMGRVLNSQKADIDDVVRIVADMKGTKVIDELNSVDPLAALSANMGRHLDLTKAPRVHTSPFGSTFGRATISLFGHAKASDSDPLMDGTVFRGTDDGQYARGDHRHPTDNTRAPLDSPELTGHPKTPTPADDSNDKSIVNTEWILKNIAEGSRWGISVTPSNTADKVANLGASPGHTAKFRLRIGALVVIKFNETNLAENARMNVDGTGMLPIVYQDHPAEPYMIERGIDHLFVYDGSNWRIINPSLSGSEIFGGSNEAGGFKVNPNQITGYLGYTTEGFGGEGITEDGEVNRALISIPFRSKKEGNPQVKISDGVNDWALRMGDNTLVEVQNPTLIYVSKASAVVQFTMKTKYPSNSPCSLVIRRPEAFIKIESSQQELQFVSVQGIGNIQESIPVGSRLLLSQFYVMPINATNQSVQWTLKNTGTTGAAISNNTLIVDKSGTVVIEARIKNGTSPTSDFVKQYNIKVISAGITITRQPESYMEVDYGNITESINVNATSGSDELVYQWYWNNTNTNTGGSIMPGEENPRLRIPIASAVGTKYYFCEITVKNDPTMKTRTSCAQVATIKKATSITIENKPTSVLEYSTLLLTTKILPLDSTHKRVSWSSTNKDVAIVNDNGELFTYLTGTSTIRASIDGVHDEFTVEVKKLINISIIKNIPTEMESGSEIMLNPVIEPSNATYQNIEWAIPETNGNTVELVGNKVKATGVGKFILRATVKGTNGYIYFQDFEIGLNAAFVNVTDITLANTTTWQTVPLYLERSIIPPNASKQTIEWSIVDDGETHASISSTSLVATAIGTTKIRATIKNGKKTEDFTKDFDIIIKEKSPEIENIKIPTKFKANSTKPIQLVFTPLIAESKYTTTLRLTGNIPEGISIEGDQLKSVKDSAEDQEVQIEVKCVDKNNPAHVVTRVILCTVSANRKSLQTIDLDHTYYGLGNYRNILELITVPEDYELTQVKWEIVDAGTTGATLSKIPGDETRIKINVTNIGMVKVRATVPHAIDVDKDLVSEFEIRISPVLPPFESISGIPSQIVAGIPFIGKLTISPNNDEYTIYEPQYLDNNPCEGTMYVDEATNNMVLAAKRTGTMKFNLYWPIVDIPSKLFNITVLPYEAVSSLSLQTGPFNTVDGKNEFDLNPSFSPSTTPMKTVEYSVVGTPPPNKIEFDHQNHKIIIHDKYSGSVKIKATIKNGSAIGTDYENTFNISFTE